MDFTTRDELTAFVTHELHAVAPAGWTVHGGDGSWEVRRPHPGGAWDDYRFRLLWDGDCSQLLVTHGNTDLGPMRIEKALLRATVIDLAGLHWHSLSDLLRAVFENEPNSWGLT